MRIDFVAHEMTLTEIASLIAVEVEKGKFGLADALRTACWYCLEIDSSITGKRFAEVVSLGVV